MNIFNDWISRFHSYFSNFSEKFQDIYKNPSALIGILALIVLIIALLKFKKIKISAPMLARIAIAIAIACVLQILRIFHFPMGGSITLGGMVPLLIISFMYGPEVGMLTGFVYGLLNLFLDPYILHPVQVLLDYPLPSIAIGLAGYFKEKPLLGTFIAFLVKFICHFISGVVFFGQYGADYGMNSYVYSLAVNAPMVFIEAIICMIIIHILCHKYPNKF
ncbi:energy-coupled thiamine transporter ThiT [Clostridium sp. MSJ-8]|uniref:energy-coupled thiamine transporter ThiT n=1 Tax=Clostridium sp. MSJ-8 TaxID=2841510 RepID=UPI001C0F2047|nr:energy-coupled thiamine transporter ThiT [Clostridium sp. MSJ-8]MBU5488712.1 energy-coupled thiamine transporter ThiT [Clostridium sp. MSJ-8]